MNNEKNMQSLIDYIRCSEPKVNIKIYSYTVMQCKSCGAIFGISHGNKKCPICSDTSNKGRKTLGYVSRETYKIIKDGIIVMPDWRDFKTCL